MPDQLLVEVVSPDRTAFRGEARSFRAPGIEGAFEVLKGHAPMLAATGVGQTIVTTTSGERVTIATSGGFVEVLDDRVIMLAETAEPTSEIDTQRAKEAEERARQRLAEATGAEREEAQAELDRARNRLRGAMGGV